MKMSRNRRKNGKESQKEETKCAFFFLMHVHFNHVSKVSSLIHTVFPNGLEWGKNGRNKITS